MNKTEANEKIRKLIAKETQEYVMSFDGNRDEKYRAAAKASGLRKDYLEKYAKGTIPNGNQRTKWEKAIGKLNFIENTLKELTKKNQSESTEDIMKKWGFDINKLQPITERDEEIYKCAEEVSKLNMSNAETYKFIRVLIMCNDMNRLRNAMIK